MAIMNLLTKEMINKMVLQILNPIYKRKSQTIAAIKIQPVFLDMRNKSLCKAVAVVDMDRISIVNLTMFTPLRLIIEILALEKL